MFCIPPCIFQVSRVTSTTDSQQYYIYRLGPPQNLFLFFLFLLPSPGDCGSNFVLGDQLCFSWFSVKVSISCCTPATLADASLFTTRPTMGLFFIFASWASGAFTRWKAHGKETTLATRPTLELGKDEVTTTTTSIGNKTRRLLMNEAATFVLTTSWMRCKAKI